MSHPRQVLLARSEAVVIYDGEPATPKWFEARRAGITGTDLPKILGLTRYGNALSVWRDKRGELPEDEEREAAHWGHILEDPVAQEWARRNQTAVQRIGVVANGKQPWIRASLDRVVEVCPDSPADSFACGLEVKTRSAYKAHEYRDDIPDDVLAQVQWGLIATGFDHMHVAVLIGGQKLRSFRVDRDPQLEEYLAEAAEAVWEAVEAGNPPVVHPNIEGVLLDQLNDMYRDRKGDRQLPVKAEIWLQVYRAGAQLERQGKGLKVKGKTGLVQMLGDGTAGLLGDEIAFTYKAPDATDQVTSDDLAKLRADNPELYAELKEDGYITRTDPGPRFNLKRKARA